MKMDGDGQDGDSDLIGKGSRRLNAPQIEISRVRPFSGTNNSALQPQSLKTTTSEPYQWSSMCVGSKKRPHHQDIGSFYDGPPSKVYVNEERVAMQFGNMSLQNSHTQSELQPVRSLSSMWKHYYDLEDKLEVAPDTEVDEGVDMGSDLDLSTQPPDHKLHVSPLIQEKFSEKLPCIIVPKYTINAISPQMQVVLWKPGGVELLKDAGIESESNSSPLAAQSAKERRKKKVTTRSLSANSSFTNRLLVPDIRPDTPPPTSCTLAVSDDIAVSFLDKSTAEPGMEF